MKKLILSALLFVMLFAVNYESTKATCPSGYTSITQTFGPDANGCSWLVSFCYTCGITNLDTCNIKNVSITPLGGCDLVNLDQSWLVRQFRSYLINSCTIQPCDSGGCTKFSAQIPLCYKWHSRGWNDINSVYHFVSWLEYCNDGSYCEVIDGICFDGSTYQHCGFMIKQSYNTNCQAENISKPINPPYSGWIGDAYSNCFQYFDCSNIQR